MGSKLLYMCVTYILRALVRGVDCENSSNKTVSHFGGDESLGTRVTLDFLVVMKCDI